VNTSNFYIKFVGEGEKRSIDLEMLGLAISGYSKVIEEIVKTSGINGDTHIKVEKVADGSIILHLVIEVISEIPFDDLKNYYEFLQAIHKDIYSPAVDFFKDVAETGVDVEKKINEHFAAYPVRFYLVARFVEEAFKWIRLQKYRPTTEDEEGNILPKKYAGKFRKLIKSNKFKKAMKPFVENKFKRVSVSTDITFNKAKNIDAENFGDYLSEDEQILPALKNGDRHKFSGKIVSLQSSRGDFMKFKVSGLPKKYSLLLAFPGDGTSTEDYLEFYKKNTVIEAEILRKSAYQKPQLIVHKIDHEQGALELE